MALVPRSRQPADATLATLALPPTPPPPRTGDIELPATPAAAVPRVPTPPAGTTTPTPTGPRTFRDYVIEQADKWKVDPDLALSVIQIESGGKHDVISDQGAVGMMQVLPRTAAAYGLDATDPYENIEAGMRVLREGMEATNFDPIRTIRRYHGGPDPKRWGPKNLAHAQAVVADLQKRLRARTAAAKDVGTPPPGRRPPAVSAGASWEPREVPAGEAAVTQVLGPTIAPYVVGPTSLPARALRSTANIVSEVGRQFDPLAMAQGAGALISGLVADPVGVVKAIEAPGQQLWKEGQEAEQRGDYLLAAQKYGTASLPLMEQPANEYIEDIKAGDWERGVGGLIGLGMSLGLPKAVGAQPRQVIPPIFPSRLNAAEQAAVEFGQRHGIPIDVATASGSPRALRLQRSIEATAGGAVPAEVRAQVRAERLPQVGEQLAARVHPQPVTPEQAGARLTTRLEQGMEQAHREANTAYSEVRRIEADPRHLQRVQTGTRTEVSPVIDPVTKQPYTRTVPIVEEIPLPVDLRQTKATLRPLRDRLRRQLPITQQQASPGLRALDNLIDGPDFAPLSQVDVDLGTIKSLARGADLPQLRDISQGVAARAVDALDDAVRQTAQRADPRALAALEEGRRATRLKYAIQEVYDQLKVEPVQAFRQARAPADTRIEFLRDLQRYAPEEMPRVGRAALDEMLEMSTAEGGFNRGAAFWKNWQKLGPQTRQILYGPHAADIDHFARLVKLLERSPNPSGTALTLTTARSSWLLFANPITGIPMNLGTRALSALMNSPTGARLLVEGLRIPAGTAQAATWAANMMRLLERNPEVGTPPPGSETQTRPPLPPRPSP